MARRYITRETTTLSDVLGVACIAAGTIIFLGVLLNPFSTDSILFHAFGLFLYCLPIHLLWLGYQLVTLKVSDRRKLNVVRVALSCPALFWCAGSIEILANHSPSPYNAVLFGKFGVAPLLIFGKFFSSSWSVVLMTSLAILLAGFVLFSPVLSFVHTLSQKIRDSKQSRRSNRSIAVVQATVSPPVAKKAVSEGNETLPAVEAISDQPSVPVVSTECRRVKAEHDVALPLSILPDFPIGNVNPESLIAELTEFERILLEAIHQLLGISLERATATEPMVGISSMQFSFQPTSSNRKSIKQLLSMNYDLAVKVNRSPVRIAITDKILIEVPLSKENRRYVYIKEMLSSDIPPVEPTYLVGKTMEGLPLELPIKKSLHVLVGGQTGTGKSVLLHSIIFGLVFRWKPSEVQVALYDHKVVEFRRYAQLPHLWAPIADTTNKFEMLLDKLEAELERRKRVRAQDRNAKFPLLAVIMDEFRGLTTMRLTTLISECRSLDMTFILATQYPRADVISTTIKANLSTGICFRMRDSTGSRLITGESGGEDLLDNGDCLVNTPFSFEHAQAAYCREEDLQSLESYLDSLH